MALDNSHFAVLVDLRRLPDYDGVDHDTSNAWLGVTLQTGIGTLRPEEVEDFFVKVRKLKVPAEDKPDEWAVYEQTLKDELAPLMPWYWQNPKPRLFGRPGDGPWVEIADTEIVDLDNDGAQQQVAWDAYRRRLLTIASQRSEGYSSVGGFRVALAGGADETPRPPLDDKAFNWVGFVGARSQQPGWLAHRTPDLEAHLDASIVKGGPQLAYVVKLPRKNLYDKATSKPLYRKLLLVFASESPALYRNPKPDLRNNPVQMRCRDKFNGHDVAFYVDPIELERPQSAIGSYLDISTLLIGKQPKDVLNEFLVDRDWLRDLPLALARAADLPGALIAEYGAALAAWEHDSTAPNPFPPNAEDDEKTCKALMQALIALLRDVAGCGARTNSDDGKLALTGPDGLNLAKIMLQQVPLGEQAVALQAYKALKIWDATVDEDKWWTVLSAAVPALRELCGATRDATKFDGALAFKFLKPDERITRLRAIYSSVVDEQTLPDVVLAQWDAALAAAPEDIKRFWSSNRGALRTFLLKLQIRDRLLFDTMGLVWPRLLGKMDELRASPQAEKLRIAATFAMADYAFARLGLMPSRPYDIRFRPQVPPYGPALWSKVVDAICSTFRDAALAALPADSKDHGFDVQIGDGSETPLPHPLVVQVDRAAADAFAPIDDGEPQRPSVADDDYLQHLAGYGLLIRRRPELSDLKTKWRCLSFGRIERPGQGVGDVELTEATAIPFAVGYENGGRRALIEYDERPLFGTTGGEVEDTLQVDGVLQASVNKAISFSRKSRPEAELGRLVPLAFGHFYDTISFAIENSGAFPRRFANLAKPMLLRYDLKDLDVDGEDYELKKHRRTVRYLRRVGVGPITQDWNKLAATSGSLVFPSDVQTKAAELLALRRSRDADTDQTKICLLTNASNTRGVLPQISMTLYPPICQFSVFDRWRAADDDAIWKPHRRKVRDAWLNDRFENKKFRKESSSDNRIEDPAVEALVVRIERLGLDGQEIPGPPESICVVALDRLTPAGNGFDLTWSGVNLATTVAVTDGLVQAKVTHDSVIGLRVEVPDQVDGGAHNPVYLLRVFPAVRAGLFDAPADIETRKADARIHPNLAEAATEYVQTDPVSGAVVQTYYLFAPFQLCLEAVSPQLPLAEDMFAKCKAGPEVVVTPEGEKRYVRARLKKPADGKPGRAVMDNVGRFDTRWQVYRWDGRPLTPLPPVDATGQFELSDTATSPLDEIRHWDVEGFGWRYDHDAASAIRQINLADEPVTFEEERTGDVQARYYRIAATAISRYRWIFPSATRVVQDKDKSRWFRTLLAAHPERVPDPPVVKLVLPLTRSATDAKARSADLLVVVSETWGQAGGVLAERLQAEVATAYLNPKGKPPLVKPELGPDPLLWGDLERKNPNDTRDTPPDEGFNIKTLPRLEVVGPLGHTFDTDSSAPLFVSTSFIVKAPGEDEIQRPWSMMKLRFQRALLPELVASPAVTGPLGVAGMPQQATWLVRAGTPLKTDVTFTTQLGGATTTAAIVRIDTDAATDNITFSEPKRPPHRKLQGPLPGKMSKTGGKDCEIRLVASRIATGWDDAHPPKPWATFDITVSMRIPSPLYDEANKPLARRRAEWLRLARSEVRVPCDEPPKGQPVEAVLTMNFENAPRAPTTAGTAYVSSYTSGHWCQVLPGDSFLSRGESTHNFENWQLSRDDNGNWRINQGGVGLRGRTKLDDPAVDKRPAQWSLFNWIVVTRPVSSGDGNPDHEAYVGVLESKADDATVFRMLGPDSAPAEGKYYGRILDMQMDPRYAADGKFALPEGDPWALVFGDAVNPDASYQPKENNAGEDARARVLKIYPRFGGA